MPVAHQHTLTPDEYAELTTLLCQRDTPLYEMDNVWNKTMFPERPNISIQFDDDRRPNNVFIRPTSDLPDGEWAILHSGDTPDTTVSICQGSPMEAVA